MSLGRFITFEGIDGAGKSSHIGSLSRWLEQKKIRCHTTREPGGTPISEEIRQLMLSSPVRAKTEALLAFAARYEHLEQVIKPMLANGNWVISDRFTESSYAYQGAGRQLGTEPIAWLESWIQGEFRPDLTFVFDLEPKIARIRIQSRLLSENAPDVGPSQSLRLDNFEQLNDEFFNQVRSQYLELAAKQPDRFHVLDANQATNTIFEEIISRIITLV